MTYTGNTLVILNFCFTKNYHSNTVCSEFLKKWLISLIFFLNTYFADFCEHHSYSKASTLKSHDRNFVISKKKFDFLKQWKSGKHVRSCEVSQVTRFRERATGWRNLGLITHINRDERLRLGTWFQRLLSKFFRQCTV